MSGQGRILDVLSQFMRSAEWQESVQIFVEANCSHFKHSSSNEFSHEQFKVWNNFQGIVESILASALDDGASCSLKEFERALEDLSKEPASGPREGVKREILSQLLTYSDFADFSTMMCVAATYQYPEPGNAAAVHEGDQQGLREDLREENRAVLLQLSFPKDFVDRVIADSVQDSSLDHLIDQLTNMQDAAPLIPAVKKRSDSDVSISIDADDKAETCKQYYGNSSMDSGGIVDQESLENECLRAFAQETLQDAGELRAKFVIALSILDSVDAGDMSDGMLEQLGWASSMCTLFQELVTSFNRGVPFEQYNFTHNRGLLNWFDELDKTFFSLNVGSNRAGSISEAELRRIVALEDLAAMGTDDERLLHGLISRHEEVLRELSGLHGKCILMTSMTAKGTRIKREHLEELYLYLKQKVNSGQDLSSVSDEMYSQVSQLVSSDVSTDAVNLILDIHVLEDEQILLKRQIMALLQDPSASKTDSVEEDVQEISLFGLSDIKKDDKNGFEFKSPERKAWVDLSVTGAASSALVKPQYILPPLVSPGKEYAGIRQEIKDKYANEDLEAARLAKIRELHRNGLKNLTNILQDQKARAMKAMERRIARRHEVDANGDDNDEIGQNTRNMIEGGMNAARDVYAALNLDEFAEIEEALVVGYKGRCVQETRLAGKNGGILTVEMAAQAKVNAAEELKRMHELELKKLMAELAQSREKERNRIQDMLRIRRQQKGGGNSSSDLQAEGIRLLKEFELEFDEKDAKAIAEVQKRGCISLAAVVTAHQGEDSCTESVIDMLCGGNILSILQHESETLSAEKNKQNAAEDDNYFGYSAGKSPIALSTDEIEQWLVNLREFTSSYGAAGVSLTRKVQFASEDTSGASTMVHSKVLGVVLSACEAQMLDDQYNYLSFTHKEKRKTEIMDTIKARILDEFEKSRLKSEMDNTLANEQRSERLKKRLEKNKNKSRFDDDGIEVVGNSIEEEKGASILASAIDILMDESTEETLSSVVKVYDQAIFDYNKSKSSNLRSVADRTEKEKMIAAERDYKKGLTDDLYAQMAMRKGNLEERLRQKKFKNIAYTSATAETKDSHHVHLETHDEDEDKLRKLEQAFGLVTDLVQGANGEVLQKMDLDSLLALIDHATKVKNAGSGAEVKRLPLAAKMSENNYREGYEDILKDIDTLLGSKGLGGLPMTDLNTEREQRQRYKEHMDAIMQNKAKTLSSEYNVEKEKYDLKMKIEQARQQQSLQRKLLERRQSNASRPLAPTGGAGYSSVAAGNLLAGMMSHADKSKIGASPAKPFIPDFIAASKSRGLSTNNLYHK